MSTRRAMQLGFLLLTVVSVFMLRLNAESWCPFGGIEAFYTYLCEGNLVCSLGVSNFYVLAALLASVFLVRRAFCGYLCPIGALSEWLYGAGQRLGVPNLQISRGVDRLLSVSKYLVLAAILSVTWQAGELLFRGYCPAYVLLGRHGEDITIWAYVVVGLIVVFSLFISMPFCRWFCPLAAAINPLSRFGLGRIRRNSVSCSSCKRCNRVCPMEIPVAHLSEVKAARCISCLKCVDACGGEKSLAFGPPIWFGGTWRGSIVAVVLFACMCGAAVAAYVAPFPSFIKSRGDLPKQIASLELRLSGLTCRGRANLLVGFLERDDIYAILGKETGRPGYYRIEAWPNAQWARVRISYDPEAADSAAIKLAISEPYFDLATNRWWLSPFVIQGERFTPPDVRAGPSP